MSDVKKIPDGFHSVTPYVTFKSADAAIKFYEKALGAKEAMRLSGPNGSIGHAEIVIGDSRIMMSDESPMMGNKSAESLGGSPVSLMAYVDDVDTAFQKAIEAGCTVRRPVADQFYGDRTGTLLDPFGMQWTLGTHIEDVSEDEMRQRMDKMMGAGT